MARPRLSQAVIRNAILAAQECGLPIGAIDLTPDGGARILVRDGAAPLSSPQNEEDAWDKATGVAS
jgi:hypothetical protein